MALRKTSDLARALEELKFAVDMAPCRVEMMRALVAAALDTGDRAAAIRELRRVLAWDPRDQSTRAALEKVLRAP